MINYKLLIVGLLFCVMLLVELIFNFTGLLKENYKEYEKQQREMFQNSPTSSTTTTTQTLQFERNEHDTVTDDNNEDDDIYLTKKIKSVTFNGAKINILPLLNEIPTQKIIVYDKNERNKVLSFENGIINKVTKNILDSKQYFELIRINSHRDYRNHLVNFSEDNTYPFYIIKPFNNPNYILSLNNQFSVIEPSDFKNNNKITELHSEQNIEASLGNVKIDLSLSNETKDKIFSQIQDMEFGDYIYHKQERDENRLKEFENKWSNYNLDKKDWIPKKAVESLCLRCDPDLIQ